MASRQYLKPRDVVKLAFQYQETDCVPYTLSLNPDQGAARTEFYSAESWRERVVRYLADVAGVDNFLAHEGFVSRDDGMQRDCLGCVWQMGSTHHLVDWPLHEPDMGDYRLPELDGYFERHLRPVWPEQVRNTASQFRVISHTFGLFERAWSLRGFENFLVDLAVNHTFAEELLEHVTEWLLQSVDLMAAAPVDAIMLTDDHAGQRGLLMGDERWRRFFKPRWKRIYERVHHYGLYTIMHMCGDTSAVVPDLIEMGLDCMESCQPECMDIYKLKRNYGRDIRFWGGLGAQSVLPFGTPDDVGTETRRLKREMGCGGGFVLASTKPPGEEVAIANIAAYLEEASAPRF